MIGTIYQPNFNYSEKSKIIQYGEFGMIVNI